MNIILIKIKDDYHGIIDNTNAIFFASCISTKIAEETNITSEGLVQVTGILLNLMFHHTDISAERPSEIQGICTTVSAINETVGPESHSHSQSLIRTHC